ncbi:alpha/beta hydrolase [Aldersonia kunmingensis]|uniref:alpha/beta hydrolase n=1 Tax=Aldersonia kunmingensis TaxID=408066 RepID=UPI00082B173B|nr:alpha/beta hydrolase family protein [Aldersonia kunmingensis]
MRGLVTVVLALLLLLTAPQAVAQPGSAGLGSGGSSGSLGGPPPPSNGPTELLSRTPLSPTRTALWIRSGAMQRDIAVQVLHPTSGAARPSFYLLDGLDPGVGQSTWTNATDAERFFAGKNVNVVLPIGGIAGYYTDWTWPDPVLGNYKWETFLTRELPPIINREFRGNGVNAIGGLSMGGHAAFALATRNPWLYRAVAGYSACPDNFFAQFPMLASIAFRGANPGNMWGLPGDPQWAAHDPAANVGALRGKAIYLWTGNGVPGPHEFELKPQLPEAIFLGGPIEAYVLSCVAAFAQRLGFARIPARVVYRPTGTHSWPYWQDALHDSWGTIGPAIGAR